MKLIRIFGPMAPTDLPATHPLRTKSSYWNVYAAGVVRALQTLGVEIRGSCTPSFYYTFEVEKDDGKKVGVDAGFCYADDPREYMPVDSVDLQFKFRFHPTREGCAPPEHVYPGGFPLVYGDGSEFVIFDALLPDLRKRKALRQTAGVAMTQHTFRVIGGAGPHAYPNRKRFQNHGSMRQYPVQDPIQPLVQWMNQLASFRCALNLCGNGNSIDRKVVEMCALGCAIISDRGLQDLHLPFGQHFRQGMNVLFVDRPEDVAKRELELARDPSLWECLVDQSRRLYDNALSAPALGQWYWHCVQEFVE